MKAETTQTLQETLRFERGVPASARKVFAAYVDIETRAKWSTPSPHAEFTYKTHDFRIGGEDRFLCGDKGAPQFVGEVKYLDIVEGKRIVYSETVSTSGDRLAVSLVTWELEEASGRHTRLTVTDHVVSFCGQAMIDGNRSGMGAALDNLVAAVASADSPT